MVPNSVARAKCCTPVEGIEQGSLQPEGTGAAACPWDRDLCEEECGGCLTRTSSSGVLL